jgi:basic membrane protein A
MKLTRRTLTAAALAAGLAAGTAGAQDDPFKVGFVYVGPIGDYGWTWTHDQGRLAVEEAFGDAVETVYAESVPEGADAERVITQMILDGADMIFTTSFGYGEATNAVAGASPTWCSSTPRATCASIRTSRPTRPASTRAAR